MSEHINKSIKCYINNVCMLKLKCWWCINLGERMYTISPQCQNNNLETKQCEQLWIFESALFTFPILEKKPTLFASRELNNIQAISPSQGEDRHHSNSRKFEKLWAGYSSGSGSSSACVESLDWNRYTLIGSKSDSSGGEMRYGKERGEATPSADTYTQECIKQ